MISCVKKLDVIVALVRVKKFKARSLSTSRLAVPPTLARTMIEHEGNLLFAQD